MIKKSFLLFVILLINFGFALIDDLVIAYDTLLASVLEKDYLEVLIAPNYNWITLSFLSLLTVGLISVIGMMFGEIFGERVKAYSKNLFYSTIKSTIIIIIIITIFLFVSATQYSEYYLFNLLSIDMAIEQANMIRGTILRHFSLMTIATALFSLIGNLSPYLKAAGIIGVSFSIAPAFRPFFDITGILLSALTTSAGVWFGQMWFLAFVKTKLLSLFLPIGIFLRATKFESIGNALIALAIGFFFIYPMILNIAVEAYWEYIKIQSSKEYKVVSSDGKEFKDISSCVKYKIEELKKGRKKIKCEISGDGIWDFLWNLIKTSNDYMTDNAKDNFLIFLLMFLFSGGGIIISTVGVLIISTLIIFIKISIEYVVILSLLLPAIVIFLTFLAIDEIAKFLGTEIDISAFEKIF